MIQEWICISTPGSLFRSIGLHSTRELILKISRITYVYLHKQYGDVIHSIFLHSVWNLTKTYGIQSFFQLNNDHYIKHYCWLLSIIRYNWQYQEFCYQWRIFHNYETNVNSAMCGNRGNRLNFVITIYWKQLKIVNSEMYHAWVRKWSFILKIFL